MTREELREHCKKQIENCEMWARLNGEEPHGKVYEEHKLILELLEQEPREGHWIKHNTPSNTYYYDCSLCGCVAPCTETADSYLWKLSNFCPDCGARMEND